MSPTRKGATCKSRLSVGLLGEEMAGKVVVIGAGMGGLASATRLAARGYDVTLVEKENTVGGKARRVTTNRGRPKSSDRARLEREVMPEWAAEAGLGSWDLAVDGSAFDAWVTAYDYEDLTTPAGVGTFEFLDVEEFEATTNQHITTLELETGAIDILHHWERLTVAKLGFDPVALSMTFELEKVQDGAMLTFIVPREVLDAQADGYDANFEIIVDGAIASEYEEDASSTDRLINLPLKEGAQRVEVFGTVHGAEVFLPSIDAPVATPAPIAHKPDD